jgi:hypothetical protein
MDTAVIVALVAAGTSLIVAVGNSMATQYWGARNTAQLKDVEQLNAELLLTDRELRNRRLDAYQVLWSTFARIPKHPNSLPQRSEMATLHAELADWYYRTGGILLSDSSRAALFTLRDYVRSITAIDGESDGIRELVGTDEYLVLSDLASCVRTFLTIDVFSRRETRLSRDDHRQAQVNARVLSIAQEHSVLRGHIPEFT